MTKPSGPIGAALLGANVGFLAVGILNVAAEASAPAKTFLTFYKPMGPLSGKIAIAYVLAAVVFLVFFKLWKEKEANLKKWLWITAACLILGTLLVFPPFLGPMLDLFIKG